MLDRLMFASLQGLIALAGVGAICLIFRKLPATFKVWLWRLAMLKMAFALFVAAPTLRILPAEKVVKAAKSSETLVAANRPVEEMTFSVVPTPSRGSTSVSARVEPAPQPVAPPIPKPATPISGWLLAWISGAALMCSIAFGALLFARKTAKRTSPVQDTEAHESAREAAATIGLRKAPALRSFAYSGSPFVTGLLRPLVAVPETLLANLRELRLTLLHEFAHLRRGDLRWSFVMNMLRGLFWFHPLAWIAEREHRVQSEIACDAFVVRSGEDRRDYALALVRMAVNGGPHRGTAILGAVGSRRALLRRLNEMSNPNNRNLKLRTALAIALPAAVLLIPIQLAARSPQFLPESDPAVPMVVPAISPDNLDDITLPALEKLPAPTAKELEAKITEIKTASLEKPEDVNRQLVALVTLEKTQMKDLTPQQKAEVEKALHEAIQELHRALHEDLPKAMAEAEKAMKEAHGQGPDSKAMRAQIGTSVRRALEAAQRALEQVHRGGPMPKEMGMDFSHMKIDEESQKEMKKAFEQMKTMDFSHMKMDEDSQREMKKAFEEMRGMDFSKLIDEESMKELRKSLGDMKVMKFDFTKLKIDDKIREELKKAGSVRMDPNALEELRQTMTINREDMGKAMEQGAKARTEWRSLIRAGGAGNSLFLSGEDNHLVWDGTGQLVFNGKKLHVEGDKVLDENGKEVPNIRVIRIGHAPAAGQRWKVQVAPAAPGQTGRTWVYSTTPSADAAPAAPGRTWVYTTPPTPVQAPRAVTVPGQTRVFVAPPAPAAAPLVLRYSTPRTFTYTVPDAKALRLFYSNPKSLTKEQRDRLRKIDAEIQKLMRERQKLSPGYVAPTVPRGGHGGAEISPSSDFWLRDNYPGLFPPSPAPSDPGKGAEVARPAADVRPA